MCSGQCGSSLHRLYKETQINLLRCHMQASEEQFLSQSFMPSGESKFGRNVLHLSPVNPVMGQWAEQTNPVIRCNFLNNNYTMFVPQWCPALIFPLVSSFYMDIIIWNFQLIFKLRATRFISTKIILGSVLSGIFNGFYVLIFQLCYKVQWMGGGHNWGYFQIILLFPPLLLWLFVHRSEHNVSLDPPP